MRRQDLVGYLDDYRNTPKGQRLMRVMVEAIEDLWILSLSDALIAQGSSYFSTLAAVLIWARTGCDGAPDRVVYLDAIDIASGSSLLV